MRPHTPRSIDRRRMAAAVEAEGPQPPTMADADALPPGWELKYDRRSGKHYYMNYLTKMTSWEDPRSRSKSQQGNGTPQHYPIDFVAQQSGHGSPYHVYPYPSPMPLQHAFQHSSYPPSNVHTSFSPKALPKQITELGGRSYGSPLSGGSPILGQSSTPRGSPLTGRVSYVTNKLQDTSITLVNDVDVSVAKISSMFPTVSETHIKILLKKYYNREAVVISALQVEKHPISTPGPFSTPPAGGSRLQQVASGVYAGVQLSRGGASPTPPFGGSPRGSPPLRPQSGTSGTGSPLSAPIPHSSPKMKLRYLKSIFPKVEETLILDILAGEENNVQKASQRLLTMGYQKRDQSTPKPHSTPREPEPPKASPLPVTPPRLKSTQEKQALKVHLQKKYSSIPERVVSIALESVGWSEERAEQILSVVLQEDVINKKAKEEELEQKGEAEIEIIIEADTPTCDDNKACDASPISNVDEDSVESSVCNSQETILSNLTDRVNRRCKNKKEPIKSVNHIPCGPERERQSPYLTKANGPNPKIAKGAQDNLLLVDYITWNGANPELKSGSKGIISGPTKLKSEAIGGKAKGANKDLYKGPSALAKGSIYQHISSNNFSQMKVGGD